MFLKKLALTLMLALSSCGYSLRGNTRVFFENHQIRTLYVAPVKNNSYKGGVEILLYNALRKRIAQGGYVRIVDSVNQADAQINASVLAADYKPSGITTADQIAPIRTGPSNVQIASAYNVSLQVQFDLELLKTKAKIWSDSLSRQKTFLASTYLGALGTTSALINESDFERVLGDLAGNVVIDAEESMNSIF